MDPPAFLSPPPPVGPATRARVVAVAAAASAFVRGNGNGTARRWRPAVPSAAAAAGAGGRGTPPLPLPPLGFPPCQRGRAPVVAVADDAAPAAGGGVDLSRRRSQRSIIGQEKAGVSPKKLNALLVKAGRPPRDEAKWARAIEGSYLLVHAKLLATGELVAFARATSDQALNGTVWDVVVDPGLPDVPLMRRNVVKYLLNELRRSVPGCSVTLFAQPDDVDFYTGLEFVADAEDVHGMAMIEDPEVGFHS